MTFQERRITNQTGYYRPNGDPINLDEPLRLADAVTIIFKGDLGVSALKAEAKKGRLSLEKIANKSFVTIRSIQEMRQLCREENFPQNLCLKNKKLETSIGTSDMNIGSMQQDTASKKLQALKKSYNSS